jgi:hypothetical protein
MLRGVRPPVVSDTGKIFGRSVAAIERCGHFWEVHLSPSPGKVCSAPAAAARGRLSHEHG